MRHFVLVLSKYGKKISSIRVKLASGQVGPGQLGRINSARYIWYMGIWLLVGNFILLIVPRRYFCCGSICGHLLGNSCSLDLRYKTGQAFLSKVNFIIVSKYYTIFKALFGIQIKDASGRRNQKEIPTPKTEGWEKTKMTLRY